MKKITKLIVVVSILVLLFAINVNSQTVNVTFRVDMQEVIVSDSGVHIAGSFSPPLPSWDPAGIELTEPLIGSIYETTLTLNQGETIEYKFINGNAWGQDESVPAACALNGNRYITIPANDTTLTAVCFGSCLPCILPQVNITFQVDMTNETVPLQGVHVAGTFNGWDTDSTEMLPVGNDVYAVTMSLGVGEYHEYKFINGNAWGQDESVPPGCANNNNRYITVPDTDSTLIAVCFGSCDPCTTVTDVDITFQVDMSNETVAPEGVHIAGSFQGWNPAGSLMTDIGNDIWTITFTLQSGSYHEYKFINGDEWGEDETVPWYCNQNDNRFITVPDADSTLPAVCYGSCLVCNPPPADITFQVDMSLQMVSDSGVHLAGSFQGWNPGATEMIYTGDNVYEVTLTLGEGEYYEYKFINGNDWPGAETVPGECSNYNGNREFFVPSANTTLDLVCFGECDTCVIPTHTFDLKVNLEGPFNGSNMSKYLHTNGIIPASQPYNTAPWNYNGTETYTYNIHDELVDWVLIEFRQTDGDASTATPDKMLHRQAALLMTDGSIVQTDGVSPLEYTGAILQNLYVVIWHRNHLAVMSATALTPTDGDYVYDFTDALSKAYLDGQKNLGGGMYGMIGGDSDANGIVNMNDKDVNWTNKAGNAGYHGSDLNMDTQVNNPDKIDLWELNIGEYSKVP
ncbi:MAG: hypothetical protein H8D45_30155 [Bacteroidetes bacterium]|nr:hypothetical protein [Bacteroidota bacterium]MBL7103973.1 hypothetical protein [Bacteroidales bacterium]